MLNITIQATTTTIIICKHHILNILPDYWQVLGGICSKWCIKESKDDHLLQVQPRHAFPCHGLAKDANGCILWKASCPHGLAMSPHDNHLSTGSYSIPAWCRYNKITFFCIELSILTPDILLLLPTTPILYYYYYYTTSTTTTTTTATTLLMTPNSVVFCSSCCCSGCFQHVV